MTEPTQGPNPFNSMSRQDTFGIRPDLFFRLAEVAPSRPEMDALMQHQKEITDRADSLADSISGAVSKADFAQYDGDLQRKLWGEQGEFNRVTVQFQEQQREIDAAQNQAADALREAQLAAARDMTRMLFADREQQVWDSFLQVKMPRFNRTVVIAQRGSWSGTVMLQLQYSNGAFYQRGKTLSGGQVWTETIPLGDVTNAIVFYQVQTGTGYGVGESDN